MNAAAVRFSSTDALPRGVRERLFPVNRFRVSEMGVAS